MDIDQLKKTWQSQSARLDRLEEQNRELRRTVRDDKLLGRRSRLLRTYTWLIVVSVVMIPFVLLVFPYLELPLNITVMFAVTMSVLALMNSYIYRLIERIDPTAMSLRDTLAHVVGLEVSRRRIRYCSMAIGVVVVAVFLYTLYVNGEYSPLCGAVLGGVIGLVCGLRKEAEIKAQIRAMKDVLSDALRDD